MQPTQGGLGFQVLGDVWEKVAYIERQDEEGF